LLANQTIPSSFCMIRLHGYMHVIICYAYNIEAGNS